MLGSMDELSGAGAALGALLGALAMAEIAGKVVGITAGQKGWGTPRAPRCNKTNEPNEKEETDETDEPAAWVRSRIRYGAFPLRANSQSL